jgi:hypothetical protein
MSLTHQGKPARKRSVYGHNSGTTTEIVYTCPANCVSELTFVHVVNGGGSTNSIDVEWYVAADNYTSHFLAGKSLGAGDYTTFIDIDLILQSGDRIQVTPTSAGHIDTILTVTETFIPVG